MGFSLTASSVNSAMIRVYNYVFAALILTGAVAFGVASQPAFLKVLMTGAAQIGLIVLTFVLLIGVGSVRKSENAVAAKVMFGTFAVVWGLLFSGIFAAYTTASIFIALFSAAVLFLTMSFYGYFTKRDIASFGQYLFIGLIAIIIAGVVNLFVGSNMASLVISGLTILLFIGITAWDAQKIRDSLMAAESQADIDYITVNGAMSLYLDFLNLFLNLLRFIGVTVPNTSND
jgi:FtsH-binding integral membrane protein